MTLAGYRKLRTSGPENCFHRGLSMQLKLLKSLLLVREVTIEIYTISENVLRNR